ncbi:hypothetical protein GQ457_06G006850 [Hibiscus cannabinus]
MSGHVTDFGLARILLKNSPNAHLSSSLGLKGSIGYMAPEYGMDAGVSTRGDVYRFGIVILEMFMRKRTVDNMFSGDMDLQKWVSMHLTGNFRDMNLSKTNCSRHMMMASAECSLEFTEKTFPEIGRVLDVFIPQKRDKSGANFGFVRFPSKQEADTAVYMFEGAWIVDRRIQVNIAKFRSRPNFWRKKCPQDIARVAAKQNWGSNDNVPENIPVEEDRCSPEVPAEDTPHTKLFRAEKERFVDGESSKLTEQRLKRITGHVNDEALRRLESLGANHYGENYNKTPILNSISGIKLSESSSEEVSRQPSHLSPVEDTPINATCLGFSRNEELDAPRQVVEGDISGNSKAVSQEIDCFINEVDPMMAPVINNNKSSEKFNEVLGEERRLEGLDEACISGKKVSARRNDKCLTSTEVRGSTSEGNNFELPEFQDMFKEIRIEKKRYGSLSAIQEKGISEADRRMRVRSKK